jgi:hypothetical protein
MAIDFDNNGQTDRASNYLYMHMQTISLLGVIEHLSDYKSVLSGGCVRIVI